MKRVVIALLPLTLLGAGCNPKDEDNLKRDAGNLAQSASTALSNASVSGKVNAVLSWRRDLDISGIKIEVEGGKVTLSGHVPSEAQHHTILDLVKGTKGVENVDDSIKAD